MLGTAAFLGSGVAIVQMVLPSNGEESVSAATPVATETPTPKPKKSDKPNKKKPKGLTRAQKQAREDAVAVVRTQGFVTLKPTDYDPKATLRVLIGRPVGDAAGGYRAFFFNKTTFIGNDARTNSSYLRISRKGKVTVTLAYGVYQPGDQLGEPSGRKRVRFKLDGTVLTPQDTIPADSERLQRRR
ncbi:MAG TPA: LppP/LprE family lipoprotein [Solirubrobacter sp.]|nr:LppP/LprE family lipoprotein [Solirubrobacter sp.]